MDAKTARSKSEQKRWEIQQAREDKELKEIRYARFAAEELIEGSLGQIRGRIHGAVARGEEGTDWYIKEDPNRACIDLWHLGSKIRDALAVGGFKVSYNVQERSENLGDTAAPCIEEYRVLTVWVSW